jgi:hypothetical protein
VRSRHDGGQEIFGEIEEEQGTPMSPWAEEIGAVGSFQPVRNGDRGELGH